MLIEVKCICIKWQFSSCTIESVWPQHWGLSVIDTNCVQNDLKIEFLNGYSQGEKAFDLEFAVISSSSMLFKNALLVEEQLPSAHTKAEHPRAWINSTCEEHCPQSMSTASPPALLE